MSMLSPIVNDLTAGVHCLTESAARVMEERGIKVVRQDQQSAIIPDRKTQALRRIEVMEGELGRFTKLLNELRADVLHLTIE